MSILLPKWLSLPTPLRPRTGFGQILVPCPLHSVLHCVPERARNLPRHSPTKAPSGTSCRGKGNVSLLERAFKALHLVLAPCTVSSPITPLSQTHRAPHQLPALPKLASSFPPALFVGLLLSLQSPAQEPLLLPRGLQTRSSPQKAGKNPPPKDFSPMPPTPLSLPAKDPMIPNSTCEDVDLIFYTPNLNSLGFQPRNVMALICQ